MATVIAYKERIIGSRPDGNVLGVGEVLVGTKDLELLAMARLLQAGVQMEYIRGGRLVLEEQVWCRKSGTVEESKRELSFNPLLIDKDGNGMVIKEVMWGGQSCVVVGACIAPDVETVFRDGVRTGPQLGIPAVAYIRHTSGKKESGG